MTRQVKVLVLTGYGLNCDMETAHAFKMAGAAPERVHINSLITGDVRLEDYQILVFGGGFSWGDDHGAGVVQAVRIMTGLGDRIRHFIAEGNLVMGICNGFQTLVNTGLLPGFDGDYTRREVALLHNDCGNFRDQWVDLSVNQESPCVFTKGMDFLPLPVRHGEGKFYAAPEVIHRLEVSGQVVLRYAGRDGSPAQGAFPLNPNGAVNDIAGICDPTGRVFGLMPHPEAFTHFTHHPDWTRLKAEGRILQEKDLPGLNIFRNAVAFFKK
ncbi:phosphoribosylformylglycinamidine synthase subunit I [Desulfobotulus alkaliphilus]|uniref:Phosphoribosylformylglycinamidine synthase subunit I n=1 Tax=Desulfobotulus alkaliphilus TaxID=622671 RepID=A0A562SA27_9BACT|nr:phosphoribosylformylglycinamidine synthase I [Desulfobotulus alkaliphilus]TWI77420.1 phosphoribosylformylglycinamidine synthase subunit I [Desulfobotulus alkaliphilus]